MRVRVGSVRTRSSPKSAAYSDVEMFRVREGVKVDLSRSAVTDRNYLTPNEIENVSVVVVVEEVPRVGGYDTCIECRGTVIWSLLLIVTMKHCLDIRISERPCLRGGRTLSFRWPGIDAVPKATSSRVSPLWMWRMCTLLGEAQWRMTPSECCGMRSPQGMASVSGKSNATLRSEWVAIVYRQWAEFGCLADRSMSGRGCFLTMVVEIGSGRWRSSVIGVTGDYDRVDSG